MLGHGGIGLVLERHLPGQLTQMPRSERRAATVIVLAMVVTAAGMAH